MKLSNCSFLIIYRIIMTVRRVDILILLIFNSDNFPYHENRAHRIHRKHRRIIFITLRARLCIMKNCCENNPNCGTGGASSRNLYSSSRAHGMCSGLAPPARPNQTRFPFNAFRFFDDYFGFDESNLYPLYFPQFF